MALTLAFSAVFYQQSISEAKGNLVRQQQGLRDYLYFTNPDQVAQIQDTQLKMFERNLLKRLAALNLGMLVLGAAVSYLLARRSLRPLEEMLEAQSRFTSDAAHELRTPLTAMKLENELALRSRPIKSTDAQEVFESNLEEITKLQLLTDALLRLARSGHNVDTSQWQDYKVHDILQAATERLKDKAKKRSSSIAVAKSTALVHGDPDQLVELFVPIIGNAIKYSPEKSEIKITTRLVDNKVVVAVSDKGIGISELDLPHIFERFYRADLSRNKTSADGFGLGLSLADSIVKAHNGKITVKSNYGKGSTFRVELPAA
jgi:two-component system sensor histidine kinase CiaH